MTAMARPALLYFLLWLGVTLSTAMDLEKRVYGGQPCDNNERHYHVKLIPKDTAGKEYTCSGSLIRPQWVLTAAHCWETGWTMKALVNFHPGPHEEIDVIDFKVGRKAFKKYDILLVRLSRAPQRINTVEIPTRAQCKNDIKIGDKYRISGYIHGAHPNTGKKVLQSDDRLHCATLTAVPCAGSSGCFSDYPKKKWLCGEGNNVDTGPGDSGSGRVVGNVIYGVHNSGGVSPCVRPAAALRVCAFRKWILKTAK